MDSLVGSVGLYGRVVRETPTSSKTFFNKNNFFITQWLNILPFRRRIDEASYLKSKNRGTRVHKKGTQFRVFAKVGKIKHDYPWPDDLDPNMKSGSLAYLSYFKPLPEKPKPVTLGFEKPLVDLEKKIVEVRSLAEETGLDFTSQIISLERKYQQALEGLYTHLTPIQRLSIARHPNRPTVLDHVLNITEKWVELHGDRAGYDDPAIVTGIGTIDGKSYVFIGHQKGRNTKENISRNFGMPTPHGYRKALRIMKYADHHGFPIVTFIDTPGAFADLKSEELGQGEAIAYNLRTMFGLKVPIIAIVTGEGGSGGALAIGCANKLFMLENSAFYVASPEACAAILWKSSQAAPKAAEKLRITAEEHLRLGIADGIIPEPLGGAHRDPGWSSEQIKLTIKQAMEELGRMDTNELLHHRMMKFRSIGGIKEGDPVEPEKKRNMKLSDTKISGIETEIESLKLKILEAREPSDLTTIEAIEKLKEDIDQEITNAFISMGLDEKLKALKLELSKSSDTLTNLSLNIELQKKVEKLMEEFNSNLLQPGAYIVLKQKLKKLHLVNKLVEKKKKGEQLKNDINRKVEAQLKPIMEILKKAKDKAAKGEELDKNFSEEIEKAKEELKKILKSSNLEIIGIETKTRSTGLPISDLKTVMKVNTEIGKEIENAIDMAGLRSKIDELKEEITKNSSSERVKKLETEIKDGIAAAMELSTLKSKIQNLGMEIAENIDKGANNGSV